jgi:hypothetical protein
MKWKEATKSVWQPPTLKEASVAAVKIGTGTTIQVLTADGDDWTAKIPVYGAIATIAKSGADLYGVGELRTATQGFIDVTKKAMDDESKKEAAALKEAEAKKVEGDAAQKKLDEHIKNKKAGKCSSDVDTDTVDDVPAPTPTRNPMPTSPSVRTFSVDLSAAAITPPVVVTDPVVGPAPDPVGQSCGGSATYYEYESLTPEETWDIGNYCETGGCPSSGAAEYCVIFGCD